MKIGVWLGEDAVNTLGGAFSYTGRLMEMIDSHTFPEGVEVCFVSLFGQGTTKKELIPLVKKSSFLVKLLTKPALFKYVKRYYQWKFRRKGIAKLLKGSGVKLMYYPIQAKCLDSNFPFIATNWDIGHRSTHAFPEVMWDGNSFERREHFYNDILPKALMIFCESEAGKKELVQYTKIGEHKIRIFPLFGGLVTTLKLTQDENQVILERHGLKAREFLFYPAQFWAHKNHYNLIKAFVKVREQYPNLKLVLSGADWGTMTYVKRLIVEYGIANNVVFLGFVPVETLYCMYKNASAMIFASHFGPTNMPPIEAMEIGCPVACSDLDGHREQLGEAAVYFNSFDVVSMVSAIIEVIEHNDLYREKINLQRSKSAYSSDKAMPCLDRLLSEIVEIRACWE